MDYEQVLLHRLEGDIPRLQNDVQLLPRSEPLRARSVQNLALSRLQRWLMSHQQDDLEQAILHFTEAICLPDTHTSFRNTAREFYCFTLAIYFHAMEYKHAEHVRSCVIYFRYICRQWHGSPIYLSFPIPPAGALLNALAVQVELKLGDMHYDLEEMTDLCDELLSSDIPTDSLTGPISAYVRALTCHPLRFYGRGLSSQKGINCLRKATMRFSDLHESSIMLAWALSCRFIVTISSDDYKEGMAILDDIINFRTPGGRPSPWQKVALLFAAGVATFRFWTYEKPEDLEQAIYRNRSVLDGTSLDDSCRSEIMQQLTYLHRTRFGDTGPAENALSGTSKCINPPSYHDVAFSFAELDIAGSHTNVVWKHVNVLQSDVIESLTDMAAIEDGVRYCRRLLESYPDQEIAPLVRVRLCALFNRAFECTNEIKYLNQAISASRDHINTADPVTFHVWSLLQFIVFLSRRLLLLKLREDLNELMELFAMAADYNDRGTAVPHAALRFWASMARQFGHPSASTAYDRAMSAVQVSVTFVPTLDTQHSRFVAMTEDVKVLSLDYASYQIHTGQLKQAIETLERGRVLLWGEMRNLRTSMEQIRLADPQLADKFAAVNRELEALTSTVALSLNNNVVGGDSDLEGLDSYGHLVERRRKLLDDREELISQVQALPGLGTFLKPPCFDTLCSAASHGPVIIINHSERRSDIIILLHNASPSFIPTTDDFYARAIELQDRLLEEREKGLESDKYEDALRSVLKELYDLIGRPVIRRLNELNVPQQSRVWWCPTSVFCSLPLHAMGPIPSEVEPPRYFLDLYIPSYIPSLSALIESRKPSSQTFGEPSMLLVVQSDRFMKKAPKEMEAVQAIIPRATTLKGAAATRTVMLERLQNHQFTHVICHGILEPGKPFDSSFKLYKGERLSLLDIVRSQLPNAEFAFLAACHTAELTHESPADEALHLAAAMQYCGFRSVVGTMWAMADKDGPDLARTFYESVFSDQRQGVHHYEKTAEALRDAVVKLRSKIGKGMTLERWVNYVHFGA